MFGENDQPEVAETQVPEQDVSDLNDIARQRVLEYRQKTLNCEHFDNTEAEASAIDRSAQIIGKWESTDDPVGRQRLLEGVGREMMLVHEAPPGPISARQMPQNELGAYSDDEFRTDVNESQLKNDNPRDALETYLHEYRHAEQNYEVVKSHGVGWHSVDSQRAMAVEYNLDREHYIRPEVNQAAYERQLVETDAEQFGTRTADQILERRNELRAGEGESYSLTSDSDAIAARRLATERASHK
jgi:hypothetical protein